MGSLRSETQRAVAAALAMAALLPALAWARDGREYRGPGPFWWGGSYVASRGFASGSGLGEGEFLDLGLFIEPFQSRFLSPALVAGALLPFFPSSRPAPGFGSA